MFLSPTVNDIRRKLYMVGTYSTVGKRAKRMPDTTVENTTITFLSAFHAAVYHCEKWSEWPVK